MSNVEIKITAENVKGSENGHDLKHWKKGETYRVSQTFAKVLVDGGLAELLTAEKKAVNPAPENKAITEVEENKQKTKAKKDKPAKAKK